MDLLEVPLPTIRLRIDIESSQFFDRCEDVARENGWKIDRRREYAGRGYDQLNLHLGADADGYPMVRMVVTPREPQRPLLNVVASWQTWPIDYDEYLDTARAAYKTVLDQYKRSTGRRYQLGISKRPQAIDYENLDCGTIGYAAQKLRGLTRSLAVGPGDARDRLISSYLTFHVLRPEDLPEPLASHLDWVYSKITARPPRTQWDGSVPASVEPMRRATAARVLARLVDIADAVVRLDEICRARRSA